ncbi:MAG: 4-alpha-glucanotransferase, partial [Thermodesulfobacteriota bacterium]
MKTRGSGVLLHITSLPSPFGIGDLGPEAYRFVDFLSESKQGYWQILPLNPTVTVLGNTPYSSPSAFAGNPILISPEALIEGGVLSKSDFDNNPSSSVGSVDYEKVTKYKESVLQVTYQKNRERLTLDHEFMFFCHENSHWLDDYALFISLKESFNLGSWSEWPMDLRDRNEASLKEWKEKLKERILKEKFIQYLFFKQWACLKDYCRSKNIHIIG